MQWPELTLSAWEDTRNGVHLWTQIVGKIRLGLEPQANHWWSSTLYVSARGLTTSLMPTAAGGLEVEFDFVDHRLRCRDTSGAERAFVLEAMSVADFYAQTIEVLASFGVEVHMLARPVELPVAVPFASDVDVRPYDADAMHRFWLGLVAMEPAFKHFRAAFRGKASPVHFFWGSFDLAATRFSGRVAPPHPGGAPNCADWVMREAYSHEVSSCGYWPGGSDEGSFYSYAYPEPEGFRTSPVPDGAHYDDALGEFVLPYRSVREASDPTRYLLEFFQATYDTAATSADWDPSLAKSVI